MHTFEQAIQIARPDLSGKALSAAGPLTSAGNKAFEAYAYALTCFHGPSEYWAEHVLKLIAATREHLDRAEAVLREPVVAPAIAEEPAQ
jgi:hypothetical protein